MHDFSDWYCFKCGTLLPNPYGGLCQKCYNDLVVDLLAGLVVIAICVFTLGVIVWGLVTWAKWLLG